MPGPVGHAGVVAAVERLDQVLCVRGVFWRSGGAIDGDDGVVFAGLDGAGYGMGLRSTFSETRVRSMALTLRYPYPPSEAVNAPAARQRTYDILSPSLQENVRTLVPGWASMAETKGRECG